MSVIYIVLNVVFIAVCFALILLILLQKKSSQGLGSIAGMGSTETYWDKNKARSMEGSLEKYTKIGGTVLLVFSLVLCFVR
ncbi:MAG: preprotein translocase subunit SecG [Clostridiales bacterium]|jgi:preprotein translocase subunit SecG|nr:preprotein translocase subunit SecG [Clostridiales bacterium]